MKTTIDSETILTELMVPSYANFGGKVHGGIILSGSTPKLVRI